MIEGSLFEISHLDALEAESIFIMREVAAEFARPAMLYSIGKDSSVLLRLAQKAFAPGPVPFPLIHIDTTYKFREMIEFRDRTCAALRVKLIVHTNSAAIENGANPFDLGVSKCCSLLRTRALLDALSENRGEADAAFPPLSVAIGLADDLDIGRGDMITGVDAPPSVARRFNATLLWLNDQPLEIAKPYLLKHSSRQVCASVTRVAGVLNPATLAREHGDKLNLNEFGEVEIETHQPLYFDPYADNRATGGFIVIDPLHNHTLAVGMIAGSIAPAPAESAATAGLTVWFTGLSSAGKSTISKAVHEKLWAMGHKVEWLDGEVVRQHLNKGLGFSKEDRDENVRRIGFVAELLTRNGVITLVSAISPYRAIREEIRARIGSFLEVYVHAPLEVCEQRDLKGIYRRARAGEMHGVTGVDDPYEPPLAPEVECHTDPETPAESVKRVLDAVQAWLAQRARRIS
jgi:adenylyl-sulfate kinase